MSDAYRRTTVRDGVTLNYRTLEMLTVVDRKLSFPITLIQGSYHQGTEQSAGTHDGGGAMDVRAVNLTGAQRDSVVYALRRVGFAAWLRTPSQGDWPYHIHAIAIGDQEMSASAALQVVDYKTGKNGLKGHGPDDGPKVEWTEHSQELYMSFYGPESWDSKDWIAYAEKAGWRFNITDGRGTLRNADKLLGMIHTNGFQAEDEAKAAKLAAVSASNQAAAAQTAAANAEQAVKELTQRFDAQFPPA